MCRLVLLAAAAVMIAPSAEAAVAKGKGKAPPAAWVSPPQAGRPALKARPMGDKAVIRTVADAMGFIRGLGAGETTKTINRLQLRGSGRMTEGAATWPVTSYVYTLSLHLTAAREDIQRTAGGKAERLVRVVAGPEAWDEAAPGVDGHAAGDSALHRRLQLARTPYGFVRAMLDADPASVKVSDPGPGGAVTVAVPIEGVLTTATLDPDYRPATIAQTVDGRTIVDRYAAYRDLSEYGLMFPTRWSETVAGKAYLDLTINDGRVASYAVFPKPASLAAR